MRRCWAPLPCGLTFALEPTSNRRKSNTAHNCGVGWKCCSVTSTKHNNTTTQQHNRTTAHPFNNAHNINNRLLAHPYNCTPVQPYNRTPAQAYKCTNHTDWTRTWSCSPTARARFRLLTMCTTWCGQVGAHMPAIASSLACRLFTCASDCLARCSNCATRCPRVSRSSRVEGSMAPKRKVTFQDRSPADPRMASVSHHLNQATTCGGARATISRHASCLCPDMGAKLPSWEGETNMGCPPVRWRVSGVHILADSIG